MWPHRTLFKGAHDQHHVEILNLCLITGWDNTDKLVDILWLGTSVTTNPIIYSSATRKNESFETVQTGLASREFSSRVQKGVQETFEYQKKKKKMARSFRIIRSAKTCTRVALYKNFTLCRSNSCLKILLSDTLLMCSCWFTATNLH